MILAAIKKLFSQLKPNTQIWIAYSGGVDSQVLLHAVVQANLLFPQLKIKAIHVNHGIHADAKQWALHCRTICEAYNIPCKVVAVKIKCKPGESLEAEARIARYQAFKQFIKPDDLLLTAHHLDDQAETCLLQFLRGAGPKGLAAMPQQIKFFAGYLVRPFLAIPRSAILTYARQHKLVWIEDDSNHDPRFTRNFLRYQIMPLLKKRWPSVTKTIMRVSQHTAETDQLLTDLASQDLLTIRGKQENILLLDNLKKLSLARQKNVLRYWILKQGFLLPNTVKLKQIIFEVMHARMDAKPVVKWKGAEIRRYKNELYILKPLVTFNSKLILTWNYKEPLILPANMGILKLMPSKGHGINPTAIKGNLTVGFRQGGEKCRLLGRKGTHSLKKLLQEWNVLPWERDRIPLLYCADELVAIIGYAVCEKFAVTNDQEGLVPILER